MHTNRNGGKTMHGSCHIDSIYTCNKVTFLKAYILYFEISCFESASQQLYIRDLFLQQMNQMFIIEGQLQNWILPTQKNLPLSAHFSQLSQFQLQQLYLSFLESLQCLGSWFKSSEVNCQATNVLIYTIIGIAIINQPSIFLFMNCQLT